MKNSVCSLVLTLLCITLAVVVALFGVNFFNINIGGIFDEGTISQGLDLVGGTSVVFIATPEDGSTVSDDEMAKSITILRNRLDGMNENEATVAKVGDDKIRVEIPGESDTNAAIQKLGSTAVLTFVDSNGKTVIEGKDVVGAEAIYGTVNNGVAPEWYISLEFNENAQAAWFAATSEMAAQKGSISIYLDNEVLLTATVNEPINSTNCVISGSYDETRAKTEASLINSGNLPVAFEVAEHRTVSATLGSNALSSSLYAGAIGTLIVMIFMILVYRLPGVISAVALVSYAAVFGIILAVTNITLSLPGIAGIILTIGMAVDANVIIYERIKEELRLGKTVRASVKAGFSRAFTAILDANVTTLIAAVVLWYYGTGSVQGFAKTLFIGVILSLFTTLVVSRVLLNAFVNFKASSKHFGVSSKNEVQ